MKDKKVTIKFIFIILMILIILLLINNLETLQNYTQGKIKGYLDEPINMETGIINNEYFGISNNGDKPEETTTGLNEAIKYAERNNITNVKLEKGIYVVIGYNNSHYRGLTMQSNVNLDLNGSTILQNTNDQYAYANVSMYNIENASISNGIIMGDKDEHIYNEENGHSHEGGYGISIIACKNITVKNLEIYNMTGDGINIYGINQGEKICTNVKIENNNIHDCRRQGITIGCGEDIVICNNEIHEISGTDPQSAIDLEGNFDTEIIDEVVIQNNKIYNLNGVNSVLLVGFINNVEISSNEIEQNILVRDAKETIKVTDNVIKNSMVKFSNDYTNMSAGHNINKLIFANNQLINSNLRVSKVVNAEILNNNIKNGCIEFISSNGIIDKNVLENEDKYIDIAIELSNISGHTEKYEVNFGENEINGNYTEEFIYDEEFFKVFFRNRG